MLECIACTYKKWFYRKIFNEEFKVAFGFPQSDTCEQCGLLRVSIEAAKTDEEQATHHEKAAQEYQSLRSDSEKSKSNVDSLVLAFDLQQKLAVPTLTHSAMFYMRQLRVYNLCIHNCSS